MAKTFNERVKSFPILSTIGLASPLALKAGAGLDLVAIAVAPMIGIAIALSAAMDMFDRNRSKLSKAFSLAAVAAGGITPAILFASVPGPDALGIFVVLPFTTALAGAFNLAAHATRNKHVSASIQINDNTPKGPPAP